MDAGLSASRRGSRTPPWGRGPRSRALAALFLLALSPWRVLPAQAQGDPISIDIQARKIWRLYGLDLVLRFDPAQVAVIDAMPGTPGVQARVGAAWGPAPFVIINEVDQAAGRLHLAVSLMGPASPLTGDLILASLQLQPKRSPLEEAYALSAVELVDPGGQDIPLRWEGLVIEPLIDWRQVRPRAWLPAVGRGPQ